MKTFRGQDSRIPATITGRKLGCKQQALVDDLNGSMNGMIMVDADEMAAARAIVSRSNGQIRFHRNIYIQLTSMWDAT